MDFRQKTTWEDVFEGWYLREAARDAGWLQVAQEKGWPDWKSWRLHTASQLSAEDRGWEIYLFDDPTVEIPNMLVGPYSGWQRLLPEDRRNKATFAELVESEAFQGSPQYDGALKMLESSTFPFSTEMIGLRRPDGEVICIEGHHRSAAIALGAQLGRKLNYSRVEIIIALANLRDDEADLMNAMLKRGTTRNP